MPRSASSRGSGIARRQPRPSPPPSRVSEPTIFRHFPTKRALYLAAIDRSAEITMARWHEIAARCTSPLAALLEMGQLVLRRAAARLAAPAAPFPLVQRGQRPRSRGARARARPHRIRVRPPSVRAGARGRRDRARDRCARAHLALHGDWRAARRHPDPRSAGRSPARSDAGDHDAERAAARRVAGPLRRNDERSASAPLSPRGRRAGGGHAWQRCAGGGHLPGAHRRQARPLREPRRSGAERWRRRGRPRSCAADPARSALPGDVGGGDRGLSAVDLSRRDPRPRRARLRALVGAGQGVRLQRPDRHGALDRLHAQRPAHRRRAVPASRRSADRSASCRRSSRSATTSCARASTTSGATTRRWCAAADPRGRRRRGEAGFWDALSATTAPKRASRRRSASCRRPCGAIRATAARTSCSA